MRLLEPVEGGIGGCEGHLQKTDRTRGKNHEGDTVGWYSCWLTR